MQLTTAKLRCDQKRQTGSLCTLCRLLVRPVQVAMIEHQVPSYLPSYLPTYSLPTRSGPRGLFKNCSEVVTNQIAASAFTWIDTVTQVGNAVRWHIRRSSTIWNSGNLKFWAGGSLKRSSDD
jgi:hypothetical protein